MSNYWLNHKPLYQPLRLSNVPRPAAVCYGCHRSIEARSDVYARRQYGEPLPQFFHRRCAPARSTSEVA